VRSGDRRSPGRGLLGGGWVGLGGGGGSSRRGKSRKKADGQYYADRAQKNWSLYQWRSSRLGRKSGGRHTLNGRRERHAKGGGGTASGEKQDRAQTRRVFQEGKGGLFCGNGRSLGTKNTSDRKIVNVGRTRCGRDEERGGGGFHGIRNRKHARETHQRRGWATFFPCACCHLSTKDCLETSHLVPGSNRKCNEEITAGVSPKDSIRSTQPNWKRGYDYETLAPSGQKD